MQAGELIIGNKRVNDQMLFSLVGWLSKLDTLIQSGKIIKSCCHLEKGNIE